KTLNVKALVQAKDDLLRHFCRQLFHNPLLIKWFVLSLAAGADLRTVLSRESDSFQSAIGFCFENLFTRLSTIERELCHTLAAARRPLSQAELYYLTGHLNRDQVDWALNTLHQSSMLRRGFETTGSTPSIEYSLNEIAGEFITRIAPPGRRLFERVQAELKKL